MFRVVLHTVVPLEGAMCSELKWKGFDYLRYVLQVESGVASMPRPSTARENECHVE